MQMSQAIDVLTSWMAANRLLLNPSKTQAIWLVGHRQLAKIDGQRLSSLFPHITFSTCVRDLGAMLDSELTFWHHINLIARKCYYQLRQPRVVSRSLTHQCRLTLVHAFVTSCTDCCFSLLIGLPLGTLARLDRVLRSAARLVGGCPSFLPSLPTCVMYCIGCLYLVIVISRFLKRYLKAKRTRATAYSRALYQIRGVVQSIVRGRLRSGYRNRNLRISQSGCPEVDVRRFCVQFLSYNGIGALYDNNLVSLYQLSSIYIGL